MAQLHTFVGFDWCCKVTKLLALELLKKTVHIFVPFSLQMNSKSHCVCFPVRSLCWLGLSSLTDISEGELLWKLCFHAEVYHYLPRSCATTTKVVIFHFCIQFYRGEGRKWTLLPDNRQLLHLYWLCLNQQPSCMPFVFCIGIDPWRTVCTAGKLASIPKRENLGWNSPWFLLFDLLIPPTYILRIGMTYTVKFQFCIKPLCSG